MRGTNHAPDELDAAIMGLRQQRAAGGGDQRTARRAALVPISAEVARVGEYTADAYARLKTEMEEAVTTGRMVVEADPALITDSAWRDRDDAAFADEAFLRLCQSLREQGQLNPVGLRRLSPHNGLENYEIVFGHRRVRAARVAGLPVRAVLFDSDDRALVARMLVENAIRTDLSPFEKAQHYRRLLGEGLFSRAELAKLLGVSPQQISNVAALAELPATVMCLLGDPRQLGINAGHRLLAAARDLERIPEVIVKRVEALPEDAKLRAARLTQWLAEAPGESEKLSLVIRDRQGRRYGRLSRSGRQLLIRFQPGLDEAVIQRIAQRIPELYAEQAERTLASDLPVRAPHRN